MLVGYMRVSTAEQNVALQRDALLAAGVAPERVCEDTCSGTVTSRPGLARTLDVLREGDALVIWKLDRIGRSLTHVVELVDRLQQRGVGLKVLTGGIDTTNSTGRLVFGIFATLPNAATRHRSPLWETPRTRAIMLTGKVAWLTLMNRKIRTARRRSRGQLGRRSIENVALHVQLLVLASQPGQFFAFVSDHRRQDGSWL